MAADPITTVDQRPQTMQMAQATFAVDVMGVSAGSGDAIDGLSALPDHNDQPHLS
jgi:hypothetical protein